MRVLMVCLGNICRSPLAEGVLRDKVAKAGLNWVIDSAGTLDYHAGAAPFPLSQEVAKDNGIDISQLKARPFVPSDFDQFDLIYAMANDVLYGMQQIAGTSFDHQKAMLFLDELQPGAFQDLKDPYYGTKQDFEDVYDLIDKTCEAIISRYAKK
ncbi:MAG: low molecular weight protein-tyrosine-phosphatase [Ferruginibacter sp.]